MPTFRGGAASAMRYPALSAPETLELVDTLGPGLGFVEGGGADSFSSVIPQIGQLPGPGCRTSGCIGHVYVSALDVDGTLEATVGPRTLAEGEAEPRASGADRSPQAASTMNPRSQRGSVRMPVRGRRLRRVLAGGLACDEVLRARVLFPGVTELVATLRLAAAVARGMA